MNHYIILLIYAIINVVYAENCTCCISENYFNESIMYQHISLLDIEPSIYQPLLYKYDIITDTCDENIMVYVEYKLVSPEIGINTFETFYKGEVDLESSSRYFTNFDIESGIIPQQSNDKIEKLISYFGKSGRLPNGQYIFYFTLRTNSQSFTKTKLIDINLPLNIELISPGGLIEDISSSYTNSFIPTFNWYSDYSAFSKYEIRISEYDPTYHQSLEDALLSKSLVPSNQSIKFESVGWNTNSFQYPSVGSVDLEIGKYYVWQVRRLFNSTLGEYYDYSQINVFEVRDVDNLNFDFSDPYLEVIKSIIGKEKFNLLFSSGGELDRFTTFNNTVTLNKQEINIDVLYSILSELKQNKIVIQDIKVK